MFTDVVKIYSASLQQQPRQYDFRFQPEVIMTLNTLTSNSNIDMLIHNIKLEGIISVCVSRYIKDIKTCP